MQEYQESSSLGSDTEARHEARGGDGIDQLREILFGGVLHDLERRIARADAQHLSRENDLKYEARRRMEIIESHFQKELAALAGRVEREVTESAEALRNISREQRETSNSLEQRVVKLEEMMSQGHRQLRQEMLAQAKAFLDELETMRLDLSNTIERRLSRVERDLEIGSAADESSEP